MAKESGDREKVVARNRKALHEYFIEERLEAGLALRGSEVKSLRAGQASLADAYIEEVDGELFLVSCHIPPYAFSNLLNHEPLRPRKLLLHRQEIERLTRRIAERGYTAVALAIYFSGGKAKVEVGLARGKRQVDKRQDIRTRDEQREVRRELKQRNDGQ